MTGRSPRSDKANGPLTKAELLARVAALAREVAETREQQTATSEILRVISRSPTDLEPVAQIIAESAARLCDSPRTAVLRFDGDQIHFVAAYSTTPEAVETLRRIWPQPPDPSQLVGRVILGRRVIRIDDVAADPSLTVAAAARSVLQIRSWLGVPMLRDGQPIGCIGLYREQVAPFSDREIELVQTFADQAVIAIENVRLFTELEAKNRDLTEALDQQTATSEILRVISSSPTDVQPVLDAVAESAARLCGANDALVFRVDAGTMLRVAHFGPVPSMSEARAITPHTPTGRAIVERRAIHIHDILDEMARGEYGEARDLQQGSGFRTVLCVPLVREDSVIGVIVIRRVLVHPFTDKQTELVRTFADQAAIAIENVRLFTELQASNRDLTEALDKQTATSEILRVISSSPTDLQPVFDTIAASATRLCDALYSLVFRFDGEMITLAADDGSSPERREVIRSAYPTPPGRSSVAAQAILERRVIAIADAQSGAEYPHIAERAKAIGYRSIVSVPMLRGGAAIGAINVVRVEALPFTETQIELLKTFADQAVIAIENVRLFKELEARNLELTETLARQTATGEVLRAISRAQTDTQPVFDIIAASALQLCNASYSQVQLYDGVLIYLAALRSVNPEGDEAIRAAYPLRVGDGSAGGRAIETRSVAQIPDLLDEQSYSFKSVWEASGLRSLLAVPMLRDGEPIGTIAVGRRQSGPFPQEQVELLQTFASQAVIAIENARLFSEVQARTAELTRSVDELTALGEVSRALSSTLNLETVLQTIVTQANQLAGTAGCTIWEYNGPRAEFRLRASHYADEADAARLQALGRVTTIPRGRGVTTQVMERRQPVQIVDIATEGMYESPIRRPLVETGHRALLGIPLLSEDEVIGVLAVTRKTPGEFAPEIVRLLSTFATQSALAIQNARLFLEIEDKSRQLEVASQHKSEFLANMSHELRTPLNAIIGFSEVLAEGMFGEINDKQAEYLRDILDSGRHLLSLINDILDLSKIEAGRMELELEDFDLPGAIDNALTLVRERAGRRGIALGRAIEGRVGVIRADERKVKQVLLNLLSNAIKFTSQGGRVDVRAAVNGALVEVSVADTGVGIAPEDREAVFEEFRQVGTAAKKVEGTGLGLALSRKFIELHGGRIWVKSEVGVGSTFTFTLPLTTVT